LSPLETSAIIVTVGSVAWVVSEQRNSNSVDGTYPVVQALGPLAQGQRVQGNPRNYVVGVLCGIGGAFGQALGLILSKRGMVGDFPALSASLMRLSAASVIIWLWALMQGQFRPP